MPEDDVLLEEEGSTSSVSGVCHLILLPSGHMSGHFVTTSWQAYGIVARCLGAASSLPECERDEDTSVLLLRLINHEVSPLTTF